MVQVMKIIVTSFKMSHTRNAAISVSDPAAGNCWPTPLLTLMDLHGQVWVSLLWSHCSFLLGPDVPKVLFVPSKILFPQSCISSGGSMVGLMVTSSKKTYTIPRSTAPRAPALPAVHCWPTDDIQTQTPRQATVNPCIYGRLLDTHRLS